MLPSLHLVAVGRPINEEIELLTRPTSGESGRILEVLIVEDNPDDEALTVRALRKLNPSVQIAVARDGAEALEYLLEGKTFNGKLVSPTLIFLDLKLPKVGGLEVLRQLRSAKPASCTTVVCLSSSDEKVDTTLAYDLGANAFVRKPIDFNCYLDHVSLAARFWLTVNYRPA